MSSAAQIEANQQNARKSTGPITEEGKEASSQNAKTHGIFARIVPDEENGFAELLESIRESFQPVGGMENTIVEQIALAYFRLQRLYAYEQSAASLREDCADEIRSLEKTCLNQVPEFKPLTTLAFLCCDASSVATFKGFVENPAHRLLLRYESMITRQVQRNLDMLERIQKARKNRESFERMKDRERRRLAVIRTLGQDAYYQKSGTLELEELEEIAAKEEARITRSRSERRESAKAAREAKKRRHALASQLAADSPPVGSTPPRTAPDDELASFCRIDDSSESPSLEVGVIGLE